MNISRYLTESVRNTYTVDLGDGQPIRVLRNDDYHRLYSVEFDTVEALRAAVEAAVAAADATPTASEQGEYAVDPTRGAFERPDMPDTPRDVQPI